MLDVRDLLSSSFIGILHAYRYLACLALEFKAGTASRIASLTACGDRLIVRPRLTLAGCSTKTRERDGIYACSETQMRPAVSRREGDVQPNSAAGCNPHAGPSEEHSS